MAGTLRHKQVGQVSPGDHVCLVYDSDAALRAIVTAFVSDGLRAGEKVLYYSDVTPSETVAGWLPAADAALDRRQLEILPADYLYLDQGRFDPEQAIDGVQAAITAARADGYDRLRVAAEMSWALRGIAGSELLPAYERDIQQVFCTGRIAGLCLYDDRRFDARSVRALEELHPAGSLLPNAYYDGRMLRVLPTFSPAGLALEGEIDKTVHAVVRNVLEDVAREADGDLYVDCSGLRFCDVGGLRGFVRFGNRLAATNRTLVLHSAPHFLTEILRLSGWADYPGISCAEGSPR